MLNTQAYLFEGRDNLFSPRRLGAKVINSLMISALSYPTQTLKESHVVRTHLYGRHHTYFTKSFDIIIILSFIVHKRLS